MGFDVIWPAVHPVLPIEPGLINYMLRLPAELPRIFMAETVNLLPGTYGVLLTKIQLGTFYRNQSEHKTQREVCRRHLL